MSSHASSKGHADHARTRAEVPDDSAQVSGCDEPFPAPAPAHRRVLAQARFEVGTLLRNGEQLLVSIAFPVLALVGLVLVPVPGLESVTDVQVATPGALALAIVSTAFTGQAISVAFDRRYGVLRYLGVTPLGQGGLLTAKALAVLVIELIQLVVLAGVALALGWNPAAAGLGGAIAAVLFWLVGSWTFVAFALLLGGTMRAEGVLAVANLVWVILLGVGGLVLPVRVLPSALASVAAWLPSAPLGEGLRAALTGAGLDLGALALLTAWAVVGTLLATRFFRWSD